MSILAFNFILLHNMTIIIQSNQSTFWLSGIFMFARIIKICIGLFMLPICLGVTCAFYDLLLTVNSIGKLPIFFISGLGAYFFIHFFIFQPNYLYVFGHEITHAFFAALCGSKIRSIHISAKGGSVTTNKNNFIISLSPYFFPIYTILFCLIFLCLQLFLKVQADNYTNIFIFSIGMSLSFHLVMTINTLRIKQPDLMETGYLFSLALIYIINILVLVLCLNFIFTDIKIVEFLQQSYTSAKQIIVFVCTELFSVDK